MRVLCILITLTSVPFAEHGAQSNLSERWADPASLAPTRMFVAEPFKANVGFDDARRPNTIFCCYSSETSVLEHVHDERVALHADSDSREVTANAPAETTTLKLEDHRKVQYDITNSINIHPYATFFLLLIPTWVSICFTLFWFNPILILKINNFLRPFEIKVGGMRVPLRQVVLVGALNNHPWLLDAWVNQHIRQARKNFEQKRTVAERSIHIPVPVYLDEVTIPELNGQHLREVFGNGTGRLLIWGEGGSGKSSIACQIARWAMGADPAKRPAPYCMLPLLIERELDFEVAEGRDPFTETIRGDLQHLIGERVDDDFLAALLKQRRVLVIVDHLSEMTETTRKRVRPDVPDFPASALIVTSRRKERLGGLPLSSLEPLRVTGDYLFEFMGAYLRARGVRELFPDRQFGQAGARIAELVGDRDVTVLLVKLYLDLLVSTKEKDAEIDHEMPRNIPFLMLQYINDLNKSVPESARMDDRLVHRDAKVVAWSCVKQQFHPTSTLTTEVIEPALAEVTSERVHERLKYLEYRLRLIETVEPGRNRVRFALDPVAEYLAGIHLVEQYRSNVDSWRAFIAQADKIPSGLEAIRGFLLAVRDCCFALESEIFSPKFVPDELAERTGLDPERLKQARLQQRVKHYAFQLKAADADDRRLAAVVLGRIGPSTEAAVPVLTEALADEYSEVRLAAAEALGRIGPAAEPALSALKGALADEHSEVRLAAAEALGRIGTAAEPAVLTLTQLLVDEFPGVRLAAAKALGRIGRAAEPAAPALITALMNPAPEIRSAAATALGRMEAAVPAMMRALAAPGWQVRSGVASALGQIGPAAEAAVPSLIEALADEHSDVRLAAAEALGRIGPAAEPAVPALIEAVADPNIRRTAAWALGELGSPAAAPALFKALADPRLEVRKVIAQALERLET